MTAGTDKIECPNCGAQIAVAATLEKQITERLREKQQEETAAAERKLKAKEKKLEQLESELTQEKENIDAQIQDRLKAERAKLQKDAEKKAKETLSGEFEDVRNELEEKTKQLAAAQKVELDLRKRERAIQEEKKALELQVERKLAEERASIEEAVATRLSEERRLKDAETEKMIGDLKTQLEIATRKAEQGSQQLQGEVRELDVEAILREAFPLDDIEPVAKGVRGGDVLHRVRTRAGAACGTILWESKRTKNWSDGWIEKLKGDQREAKADLAAIVTDVLPRDIVSFGRRDGVWVTSPACLPAVAVALRSMLEQVAFVQRAAEHKDERVEALHRYLTGTEFRQRVEAIVESVAHLRDDLEKEKRATAARWAKQEKYIERTVAAIGGMYGDFRGLVGSSVQSIPALELDAGGRALPHEPEEGIGATDLS